MALTLEGGCRCGLVRFQADVDRLPNVYACRLTNREPLPQNSPFDLGKEVWIPRRG